MPKTLKAKKKTKRKNKPGAGRPKGSIKPVRRASEKQRLIKIHGNTKLTKEIKTGIAKLLGRGYSQVQVGKILGVSQSTINRWVAFNPDLRIDIKLQEQLATDMVERAMFDKATGNVVTHERKIEFDVNTGHEKTTEYKEKTHPPDTASSIFWLKNKRPDQWKDRHEIYNDGTIAHDVRLQLLEDIQKLTPDQRLTRLQFLQAKQLEAAKDEEDDIIDIETDDARWAT